MPENQLAVVIGAGGMGSAVARRLSRHYRVLLADIDGPHAAAQAKFLSEAYGDVIGTSCDVTDAESVRSLAAMIRDRGGFRVLVHIAGLSPAAGAFDTILRVNLGGPARIAQALLPMVEAGGAAIMVASLGAHLITVSPRIADLLREHAAAPDLPERLRAILGDHQAVSNLAYQLSKYGLLMLCRREAAAWGARGGRIVSLSPGLIATPMGAREFATNPAKQALFDHSPLKREGTLDEIADVIEFLASDRASFISGTDILVDGGLAGALSDVPFAGPMVHGDGDRTGGGMK